MYACLALATFTDRQSKLSVYPADTEDARECVPSPDRWANDIRLAECRKMEHSVLVISRWRCTLTLDTLYTRMVDSVKAIIVAGIDFSNVCYNTVKPCVGPTASQYPSRPCVVRLLPTRNSVQFLGLTISQLEGHFLGHFPSAANVDILRYVGLISGLAIWSCYRLQSQ